ncbi:hypothetical protein MFLAVUS_007105 [Mucor flavus]|uniref:Uncharacterized protein n=1 Tax=Mucor flavus TaxID=439312 RepID=A0ABP9Z3D8_9FUNG
MSQEKRNRRENTMFICTSDENLQSVDMPDAIGKKLRISHGRAIRGIPTVTTTLLAKAESS